MLKKIGSLLVWSYMVGCGVEPGSVSVGDEGFPIDDPMLPSFAQNDELAIYCSYNDADKLRTSALETHTGFPPLSVTSDSTTVDLILDAYNGTSGASWFTTTIYHQAGNDPTGIWKQGVRTQRVKHRVLRLFVKTTDMEQSSLVNFGQECGFFTVQ